MIPAVTHEPVIEVHRFRGRPLAIVGAGPSYDDEIIERLFSSGLGVDVFALNHTITQLWSHPLAWWVSNDMDRTFGNQGIRAGIVPRLAGYSPWRCITQRLFIPGKFGDHHWYDLKGKRRGPLDFRLPCPDGSHIAWYFGGEGHNKEFTGYVRNGHSVLELALEVATLWGFGPIVLIGCDMHMPTPETYYARPFRWKSTPAKVVRGKLNIAKKSVEDNRHRWAHQIFQTSTYWKRCPFFQVGKMKALSLLGIEAQA